MEFNIKLTEQEVNLIGNALGQMPYAAVAQLVANITNQVQAQVKKKDE